MKMTWTSLNKTMKITCKIVCNEHWHLHILKYKCLKYVGLKYYWLSFSHITEVYTYAFVIAINMFCLLYKYTWLARF